MHPLDASGEVLDQSVHAVQFCRLKQHERDRKQDALGGRVTVPGLATKILEVFLNHEFEGGRHERRIAAIEPTDAT